MKGQRSRIFGSSNKIRVNQDGRREGEGSVGLASFKKSQGHTKVCRTSQLL